MGANARVPYFISEKYAMSPVGFDPVTSRIVSNCSTKISTNPVSRCGSEPTTVPITLCRVAFPLHRNERGRKGNTFGDVMTWLVPDGDFYLESHCCCYVMQYSSLHKYVTSLFLILIYHCNCIGIEMDK